MIKARDIVNADLNISAYISSGVVDGSTLAWTIGMSAWLPISQIPTLASLINSNLQSCEGLFLT